MDPLAVLAYGLNKPCPSVEHETYPMHHNKLDAEGEGHMRPGGGIILDLLGSKIPWVKDPFGRVVFPSFSV